MATSPSSRTPARTNNRGLGRGLAALIPESDLDLLSGVARGALAPAPLIPAPLSPASHLATAPHPAQAGPSVSPERDDWRVPVEAADATNPFSGRVRYLELSQIEPNPFQPRQIWNEADLDDLAASIKQHGVLQPILVRPLPHQKGDAEGEPHFQLIAGERRWRAAARAELRFIPVIIREVDDRSALELAIIENVQRHDISAVESAQAYLRLGSEFGLSQEKIAARVGKSRAAIANTIRLLDLPAEALEALRHNAISEGHGRALLTAKSEGARRALLRRALRDGLSVRALEDLARQGNATSNTVGEASGNAAGDNGAQANDAIAKMPRAGAPDLARLENTLERSLGTRLQIRPRRRGGQLIIHYSSPEELQRLAQKLAGGSTPA